MHQSRLYGIFIDTPAADAPAAAAFWSAAFGVPARPVPGEEEFIKLHEALPGLAVDVQSVGAPARYHVDFESDDVRAEVDRLVTAGAEVETDHGGHVTLRAPGGHLFCVVPVQSEQALFDADARTWT